MSKRIEVFQHHDSEGPGWIEEWARDTGYILDVRRIDQGQSPGDERDGLIVLGGPMSARDSLEWLKVEVAVIESCLRDGVPLLAICLGAQMLAQILGGNISTMFLPEIGWGEVDFTPMASEFFGSRSRAMTFHWHGEMFDLPPGTQALASSRLTPVQAFAVNSRAVGLQFHPEARASDIQAMVDSFKPENPALLLNPAEHCAETQRDLMFSILNRIFKRA